jgi:hypothetical protein
MSPETSTDLQRTTRRYTPEDRTLHNHHCENLKSYILNCCILSRIRGLAWRIIMGSGFDDWIYWHFFTITAHTLNSFWIPYAELLRRISHKFLTDLYYFRIHECTAFYNCHAVGLEVTISNSSFVLLCCHGNAFINIRCRGNKCLLSRCLAKMTSALLLFRILGIVYLVVAYQIVIFRHNII